MKKRKNHNKILKKILFMMIPLGMLMIIAMSLIMMLSTPTPRFDKELIPQYQNYARLMGADWELLVAYDLAIHNNQAADLNPEEAAWFFLSVEYSDVDISGKQRVQDFFGETLSFEVALNRMIQFNLSGGGGVEAYKIGAKDIVSLENVLDDDVFKWVEVLIANNAIAQMAGESTYQGTSYSKLVLESKGYFAVPLPKNGYTVSSRGFGYKMHPIKKIMKFHSGQDFGASTGTPVGASAEGIVDVRWDALGYGKYVTVTHPNGMMTLYGHLSQVLVKRGEDVEKGTVIGLVGSTGGSTGPHLHFEIRKGSQYLDPMKFFR